MRNKYQIITKDGEVVATFKYLINALRMKSTYENIYIDKLYIEIIKE